MSRQLVEASGMSGQLVKEASVVPVVNHTEVPTKIDSLNPIEPGLKDGIVVGFVVKLVVVRPVVVSLVVSLTTKLTIGHN